MEMPYIMSYDKSGYIFNIIPDYIKSAGVLS